MKIRIIQKVGIANPNNKPAPFCKEYDRYIRRDWGGNSVTATIDGVAKTTVKDATGKVVTVVDPAGTIAYNYRADGQPSSIYAPGGIITSFEYDGYGRQTKLIDPSAGTKSYYYDAAGNVNSEIDANNKEIKTIYDAYNRVTSKEIVGELTTGYIYNADGQISSITGNNGTSKSYGYDGLMRLSTETENVPDGKYLQKSYTYANGTTTDISYSSQNGAIATENFLYSNGCLAETKLNNATSTWKLTQENDMGLAIAASTGSLTRTYGYDAYGLPTARTIKNGATVLQDFAYNIDPTTGNLSWRKDVTRNIQENFGYDNLNRLTGFRGITMAYDVKGNITDYPGVGSFGYKRADKPYAVTSVTPYGTATPLREQTVNYNGMQRPTLIAENGYVATLAYNPDGDRVKMQITQNGGDYLTRYYIGGQYETEAGIAGTKEKLYLSGDTYSAAAVLVKENGGVWNIYYLGRDYQGSITHLIDASGTVVQELSYDPWGRLRNPVNQELYAVGAEPIPFLGRGYTGHEHLTMFGLINMNARLYDPAVGRFLSPDPYVQSPDNSQNFNRYSYCLNNPLKYTDPSGDFFVIDSWIIGLFSGSWDEANKRAGNDIKIWGGLFTTDPNKSFGGRVWEVVSRFTWQLPQTIGGWGTAQSYNTFGLKGGVESVEYKYGATVIKTRDGGWGGITQGSYIVGDNSIEADANNPLFQHEYGHIIQELVSRVF